MSVEGLKLDLIKKIMTLQDPSKLKRLDAVLQEFRHDEVVKKLNKPTRSHLDIEALKVEQNFKPIDKKSFFKKIDKLKIKEPISDLLEMI